MHFNLVTIDDEDHSALKTPAKVVSFPLSDNIKFFIGDMEAFRHTLASPNGFPAGLAAPQIGVS